MRQKQFSELNDRRYYESKKNGSSPKIYNKPQLNNWRKKGSDIRWVISQIAQFQLQFLIESR